MWLLLVEVPFLCPALYFCLCLVGLWSTHLDRVESQDPLMCKKKKMMKKKFDRSKTARAQTLPYNTFTNA